MTEPCLEARVFWLLTIEIPNQIIYQLPRWNLESYNRINEIQLVVIPEKNIVAILPDIGNEQKLVPELISTLLLQSQCHEMLFNMLVIRTPFGPYRILAINQTGLQSILTHAKELKRRFGEKNIMNDMLINRIANIMSLQMRFGEWILDLVIQLIALDHSHITLACSYGIMRTGNLFRVKQTFRLPCGGY